MVKLTTSQESKDYNQLCQQAMVCWQMGQQEQARLLLEKAILNEPASAQAYYNLGFIKQQQGLFQQALGAYLQSTEWEPQFALGYKSVGDIFTTLGKLDLAIKYYIKALNLSPDLYEAHNNLGAALKSQAKLNIAAKAFEQAIKCKQDFIAPYFNLADIYHQQGLWQKSLEYLQEALKLQPDSGLLKFSYCMGQLPGIYVDTKEISARRTAYSESLQHLLKDVCSLDSESKAKLASEIGKATPFYLAYQGLNDRFLQQDYGRLLVELSKSKYPQWSQPISPRKRDRNQRIRIGFVSGFFHNHSVWKMPTRGWLKNLDRTKFEIFGYYTQTKQDRSTAEAKSLCDRFIETPRSLEEWSEIISQDRLDILIFPELSMDRITTQLACLRLAPVQATSWGHPITSGLSTIDYYLSSDLMESEEAEKHYTESLVRLPNLSIHYQLSEVQPQAISRKELKLTQSDVVFWCCQSLYKYLPQHDDVFPRIAQQLSSSKFIFIRAPQSEAITKIFEQRLDRVFRQYKLNFTDFCLILPRLSSAEFAGITAIANIFLDSIGWSGCNTVMESTRFDLPIVTLPGELMRSRHALAILKMMGIEQIIASSKEEYIEMAVHLGKDPDYCQEISQQIAANKHRLYEDRQAIAALQEFLLEVVG